MPEISTTLLVVAVLFAFGVGIALGFAFALCAGVVIDIPSGKFDHLVVPPPPLPARDPDVEALGDWPPIPESLRKHPISLPADCRSPTRRGGQA